MSPWSQRFALYYQVRPVPIVKPNRSSRGSFALALTVTCVVSVTTLLLSVVDVPANEVAEEDPWPPSQF